MGRILGQRLPPLDASDQVVSAVDAGHLWPRVADAMAALPDEERDALVLFVWEELGYEQIAMALSVPVGTVKSRLNRARRRLRELDEPCGRHQ